MNCDSSHQPHAKQKIYQGLLGLSHSLSIPTSNDAKGNLSWTLTWQALKDHMRQPVLMIDSRRRRMMPKPVKRIGVKASGVQQVMATEQKQNYHRRQQ
jgi:hypothetical protein